MSAIIVKDLTFAYEGSYDNIFENVSFIIDSSWRLGFTGRNGRGKTTFLKLLMGQLEYSGKIESGMDFEYFPYSVDPSLTPREIIKSKSPNAEDWQIAIEAQRLKLDDGALDRPFSTLSNGEGTKVLLAALFLRENSFLLIDEPTNHLDAEGRRTLAAYLASQQGFILVSHDRAFLDASVDHILAINKKSIDVFKGNYSTWQREKDNRDNLELAQNARHKKEIFRLKEAAERASAWSDKVEKSKTGNRVSGLRPDRGYIGHKSAKMMQRSKNIERRRQEHIEEKSALLKDIDRADSLKLSPLAFYTDKLLELENVTVRYGDHAACQNVSFDIRSGDRIALRGSNGTGKSTILKVICGEISEFEGNLIKSSRLKISYIPQTTAGLAGNLRDFAEKWQIDESLFKTILRKLDFSREQFEKDISDYSEGQKKKVLLSRSLCQQAHLYVWDEPLNYIDILSRMQIEELLLEYKPTIIFVEHDMEFCRKIATKEVNL